MKIVNVVGARPNFMKIAPLMAAYGQHATIEPLLVHTGQHYDAAMSELFFRQLGIPEPDINLEVGSASHAAQTAEIMKAFEPVMLAHRPDVVLVVGDVNSTIACGLVAVKLGARLVHVEAGLRSRDREMPEEINRLLTDAVATWLFATEPVAEANLQREGVAEDRIHLVGNVMIDTLLEHLDRARKLDTLQRLGLQRRGYALLTLHRPSNVDDPRQLRQLFGVLEEIHEKVPIVFPVHPRTAAAIQNLFGGEEPALRLVEPLGYLDFLCLMADAKLVLTDSGGIQEETTALGVACLTLRDTTERPITVTEGTNTIVGSDPATIRAEASKILDGNGKSGRVPELWDGRAASRIIDVLERELGRKR
jgi:UDP-N-acetylglucosamine 2-epimerase (non-hydrolysing)